jgi:MULE transposase domain
LSNQNLGSKAQIILDPLPCDGVRQFKCASWTFGPCIEVFCYMCHVISIDASHLRGRYEGRLLVVVGYDADNQLLPFAFGLIEKENISNWGWFMRWLRREVIGDGNKRKICVISDRHAAIKHIFNNPNYDWHEETCNSVRRLCIQHIAENILKKFKNK